MSTPKSQFAKTVAELICFWLIPLILFFSFQRWTSFTWMNNEFLFYVIAVPTIGVYLVVCTGAGWLKLWGFNIKYSIRKVPFQIGFIYSSIINLLLLFVVALLSEPSSFKTIMLFAMSMFLLGAFAGTVYDLIIVYFGFLNPSTRRFYQGESTIRVVAGYGPWFFGLMGLLSGLSVKYGRYMLIEKNLTHSIFLVCTLGTLIIYTPFLVYFLFIIERKRQKIKYSSSI